MWWEILKKDILKILQKEVPLALNIELEDAADVIVKKIKEHCKRCLFWSVP